MSVALWDTHSPALQHIHPPNMNLGGAGAPPPGPGGPLAPSQTRWTHHTEFVVGLDWSVHREGILASTGWDNQTFVWDIATGIGGGGLHRLFV